MNMNPDRNDNDPELEDEDDATAEDSDFFFEYLMDSSCLNLTEATANAVVKGGIDSFETLESYDLKMIEELTKQLLAAKVVNATKVTQTLLWLRYFLIHQSRISEPLNPKEMTLIGTMRHLKELNALAKIERGDKSKDKSSMVTPSKFTTIEKFRYTVEEIRGYCRLVRGVDGTKLSYVIRDKDYPADYQDDWSLLEVTMILRHPLTGLTFDDDNLVVWTLIKNVFHGTDGWNWVSEFGKNGNGRGAFMALTQHFLDASNCGTILNRAWSTIFLTAYKGETRNFNFEKFACKLKGAYTDLESLGEGLPESGKRRFLHLQVQSPNLEGYKGHLRQKAEEFETFEKCINFLKIKVAEDNSPTPATRSVSEIGTVTQGPSNKRYKSRDGREGKGRSPSSGPKGTYTKKTKADVNRSFTGESRYYPTWEYRMLTPENKKRLADKKHGSGDNRRVQEIVTATIQAMHITPPTPDANTTLGNSMTRRHGGGN